MKGMVNSSTKTGRRKRKGFLVKYIKEMLAKKN
jgi:hypothetical protein